MNACRHIRDRFFLAVLYETGTGSVRRWACAMRTLCPGSGWCASLPGRTIPVALGPEQGGHEVCVSGELVCLYSDYMVDEYGSLESDFVFVNLWGGPSGRR